MLLELLSFCLNALVPLFEWKAAAAQRHQANSCVPGDVVLQSSTLGRVNFACHLGSVVLLEWCN